MGFYSHLSLSLSLSLYLSLPFLLRRSVRLPLSLIAPFACHCFERVPRRSTTRTRVYRFPDSSPRPISLDATTCQPPIWNSPVTELVSRIRARPLHSGLLEYYVRVHYGGGVGQPHRRVHHGGGVWYRWHRERRTASGHHRVHSRASAHHLLYHGFLLAAQVWKTNRSSVKLLKLASTLKYRPTVANTNASSGIISCKSEFGFANRCSIRIMIYWV